MAQESKSLTVSPSDEQTYIDLYQNFGWALQSSQEVFNRSDHLETKNDSLYNVSTTVNYVKLVFVRETSMENYKEITALEEEFNVLEDLRYEIIPGFARIWARFGIGIVISMVLWGITEQYFWMLVGIPVTIILTVKTVKSANAARRRNEEIRQRNEEIQKERMELCRKAKALVK